MRLIIIPQALRVIVPPCDQPVSELDEKFVPVTGDWRIGDCRSLYGHFVEPGGSGHRNHCYHHVLLSGGEPDNFNLYELVQQPHRVGGALSMTDFIVKTELHPDLPPPNSGIGPIKWLRTNLFSTWYNSLLTLGALYLLFQIMPPLLDWAIFSADWEGKSNKDCTSGGACWALINVRFNQFMYGFYPPEHYWRVNLGFVLFRHPRRGIAD